MSIVRTKAGRRATQAVAVALGVSTVLAACGTDKKDSAKVQQVKVTARDFAFDGVPDSLKAGQVKFDVRVRGSDHEASVVRLKPGATFAQLQEAVQAQDFEKFQAVADPVTGVGALPDGMSQSVTSVLTSGDYVMMSMQSGKDGTPDIAKGMVKQFRVVGESPKGNAAAVTGKTDGTLTLKEFTFVLPDGFGKGTFKVTNGGDQLHEVILARLDDGKTLEDLKQAFAAGPQGPPPAFFHQTGGIPGIAPGQTVTASFDLPAGHYVALCFVPDPASNTPHAMLGMATEFDVK